MKQFIPIGIGLIHALLTLGLIAAFAAFDPSVLFSLEYAVLVLLMPAILVPCGLVANQILHRRFHWLAVLTGCVISAATSLFHLRFLGEAMMVV